jgi:predicted HicB family RNase H-like nuclease
MKNLMTYKDFLATIHFSPEDDCFHGRIEGINDLVSFEGRSVAELKKAFREAVDDYLEICRTTGKPVQKPFKGSFNIRISPDLHQKAARQAQIEGITLNQLVRRAMEAELKDRR